LSEDRNQLEQEAIVFLGKGKAEDALKCFQDVLRLDPKDIRIRQKIADLYLQLGKKPEAMRQMREVVLGHIGDDQFRQALVVLKSLQKLKPKDDEVWGLTGDCHKGLGFFPDAREAYEKTLELLDTKPKEALPYAARLISISPGEMPPKVAYAELLQRAGKRDEAAEAWKALGAEARRRGNASDQAAFNELSLRVSEEDAECLESAAEARILLGEPKEALVHIQKAYAANPDSGRVLSMLAQCFELMEQQPKAKKVLIQLAKLHSDQNHPVGCRDALERAYACDPDDADLKAEVGDAVARAERAEMRLTDHKWSAPKDESEGEVIIRAEVLTQYGFADRAKEVIQGASVEIRDSLSARAHLVEILVDLADVDAATAEAGAMLNDWVGDPIVVESLQIRRAALKGEFDAPDPAADEEVLELELELEDEEAEEENQEVSLASLDELGLEARGDALLAAGDTDGAIAAYREVLAADPADQAVLMKLGEVIAGAEEEPIDLPAEVVDSIPGDAPAADEDMPDFQSIFKAESPAGAKAAASPPDLSGDEAVAEARAYVLAGMFEQAIAVLQGKEDLASSVVCAQATALGGEPAKGRTLLRRSLDDASEGAPGYTEALWVLAGLQARTGKAKAAQRTLDDLVDVDSKYRSVEVDALRRGITLLLQR